MINKKKSTNKKIYKFKNKILFFKKAKKYGKYKIKTPQEYFYHNCIKDMFFTIIYNKDIK